MLIIIFNLVGALALAGTFGAYLGFNKRIIDPNSIQSWDEFVMYRNLITEWDSNANFLGWGMLIIILIVLVVDVIYYIHNKLEP